MPNDARVGAEWMKMEDPMKIDLNEHEMSEKLVTLIKASENLMKVVTKSVQMTTIPRVRDIDEFSLWCNVAIWKGGARGGGGGEETTI